MKIIRIVPLCVIFLTFSLISSFSSEVKVNFISNAGFFISTPEHGVLIDSLYTNGIAFTPAEAILNKITNGKSPFNNIKLLLITHSHYDHMDFNLMIEYLKNHPDVVLISSKEVIDSIKMLKSLYESMKDRLKEAKSDFGETDNFSINGINIKTFCIRHPGSSMANIAFLIDIDGVKIFHAGDSTLEENESYYQNFQLEKSGINLLLLNYFNNSEKDRQIVESYIKPGKIAGIHIQPQSFEENSRQFKKTFNDAIFFKKPMDKIILKNK